MRPVRLRRRDGLAVVWLGGGLLGLAASRFGVVDGVWSLRQCAALRLVDSAATPLPRQPGRLTGSLHGWRCALGGGAGWCGVRRIAAKFDLGGFVPSNDARRRVGTSELHLGRGVSVGREGGLVLGSLTYIVERLAFGGAAE